MASNLPIKKRGDRLSAAHINELSRICASVAASGRGSWLDSLICSIRATSSRSPLIIEQVIILVDRNDGIYDIGVRSYDHTADPPAWITVTGNEYTLDASESGLAFSPGDKLIAYFHSQRDAFMPFSSSTGVVLKIGKADDNIPAGNKGRINIWEENDEGTLVDTEDFIDDVRHDWVTGSTTIAEDTEVIIGYFPGESIWRIIGAECP